MITTPQGRIPAYDVLRALALFGIFFLNAPFMISFDYGYVQPLGVEQSPLWHWLKVLVLDGRFRGVFLVLLAIGMAILWQRWQADEQIDDYQKMKRRMYALAMFGFLHGILFWAGDILFSYGIAALLAWSKRDGSVQQKITRALWYMLLPAFIFLLLSSFGIYPEVTAQSQDFINFSENYNSDFLSSRADNAVNMVIMMMMTVLLIMWHQAGAILLTWALWQKNWFSDPQQGGSKQFLAIVAVLMLISSSLLIWPNSLTEFIAMESNAISGVLSAFVIIKYCHHKLTDTNALIRALCCVGRMSLTCYLGQTVLLLMFVQFYGAYMLAHFSYLDYLLLSIVNAGFWLLLCPVYLRFFKFGPMEYLWRKMT